MSKQWLFYPCVRDGQSASIFYDHGIRETVNQVAPTQLLKVWVTLKQPRPDGLSSREEYQQLCELEDELQRVIERHGGQYVGRITGGGCRLLYVFALGTETDWVAWIQPVSERFGYQLLCALKPDPARDGYWKDLFPDADHWQVILDLRVLESLQKHGDNGTTPRRIDHWAYFPKQNAAESFSGWARIQGYIFETDTEIADNGRFCVRFAHDGTCLLPEITSHTITLRRKAVELGGEYDGWETVVCKVQS